MALGDIIRVIETNDSATIQSEARDSLSIGVNPMYALPYFGEFAISDSTENVSIEETKRRLLLFFLPHILLLTSISLFLFYFILVNTVLSDRVLPFLRYENEYASLLTEQEIQQRYSDNASVSESDSIIFTINEQEVHIRKDVLDVKVDAREIIAFGKGKNISSTFEGFLGVISRRNFDLDISFHVQPVLDSFPFTISEQNAAKLIGGQLMSCEYETYDLIIDANKLRQHIEESLARHVPNVTINTSDYIVDSSDAELVALCDEKTTEEKMLIAVLNELLSSDTFLLSDYVSYYIQDGSVYWKFNDDQQIRSVISDYAARTNVPVKQAVYEEVAQKIYMLEWPSNGRILDVEKAFQSLNSWILAPNEAFSFRYDVIKPDFELTETPVIDFSQVMGTGQTKMHLVYDNTIGQAQNVVNGFEEMQNYVVLPGEEFSFFNAMNPQGPSNAYTAGGRLISMGICTTVTTLFRSVLDSGLPVIQRENHAQYVWKYQWNPGGDPSGQDLMDATFLATPGSIIDFKFKNDFEHPILIRSIVDYDTPDYQHHTVEIRTSKDEKMRDVEIGNWRVANWVSPVRFDSYFDRTVTVDGKIHIQETFFSDYQWGY